MSPYSTVQGSTYKKRESNDPLIANQIKSEIYKIKPSLLSHKKKPNANTNKSFPIPADRPFTK